MPSLDAGNDATGMQSLPRRVIELRSATNEDLLVELFEEPPAWLWRILEQLASLLRLPAGWNSHAAAPVSLMAAATLLDALRATMSDRTPLPHISPLSSGGIQMEWHERDFDVEVAIDKAGHGSLWYEDARTGTEAEISLSHPYDRLRDILVELTSRE